MKFPGFDKCMSFLSFKNLLTLKQGLPESLRLDLNLVVFHLPDLVQRSWDYSTHTLLMCSPSTIVLQNSVIAPCLPLPVGNLFLSS